MRTEEGHRNGLRSHSLLVVSPACQPETRTIAYAHNLLGSPLLCLMLRNGCCLGARDRRESEGWGFVGPGKGEKQGEPELQRASPWTVTPAGHRVLPLECPQGDIPQPKQSCIEGVAMWTVERMIMRRPQTALLLEHGGWSPYLEV